MFRFIAVVLVLMTCASAQSASLSGVVMDGSNGVPLEGATVTLQEAGLVVRTDARGRFRFDGDAGTGNVSASTAQTDTTLSKPVDGRVQSPGTAFAGVITFSKDGYGSVSRRVNATDGTENVVLTLAGKVTYVCTTADAKGRWQIARTVYDFRDHLPDRHQTVELQTQLQS